MPLLVTALNRVIDCQHKDRKDLVLVILMKTENASQQRLTVCALSYALLVDAR